MVRLIFEMAIEGKKYKQIARYLNANNIDTRVQYKERHGKKWNHPRNYEIKQWSATAVMNILFNEIYTGTIIYGKTACNAQTGYKSKKMNPDSWIIVENCHEPIVSKQTFEEAHKMINKTTCNRAKKQVSYKKAIIICGCCGKGLVNSYGYYKCSCDYDPSKYNCRDVRMKTEEFEAGVMQYVKTTAAGMLEHLQAYKKQRNSCVELQKEIDKLQQMKSKAETKKFQLYDDYTKGIVQRDIMISERTMLTEHIGEIEIELHELESKIQLEQCINKAGEEETIHFYNELFGLNVISRQEGNVIMSEGLVLQDAGIWKESMQIQTIPYNNMTELYFEDNDIEGVVKKLESGRYGARYATALTELDGGQKLVRFYDPSGNLIEVRTPWDKFVNRE